MWKARSGLLGDNSFENLRNCTMAANKTGFGGDCIDARRGDGQEAEMVPSASGAAEVDAKQQSHGFRYSLNYPSIGQCIIINNKNFDRTTGMNQRNGTDVDAGNAMKVFGKLGYKVKVYNDQSVGQIKRVLTSVSVEDHSGSASFVCVLLSHGDDGVFFGTDASVELKSLTSLFRGDRCPSLVGKPKLFFIQACRGPGLSKSCCRGGTESLSQGCLTLLEHKPSHGVSTPTTVVNKHDSACPPANDLNQVWRIAAGRNSLALSPPALQAQGEGWALAMALV